MDQTKERDRVDADQRKEAQDALRRFFGGRQPSPSITRPSPARTIKDDGTDDPYADPHSPNATSANQRGHNVVSSPVGQGDADPYRSGDEFKPVARPKPLRRAPTRHPRGRHTRRSSVYIQEEPLELQPYPRSPNPPQSQGQGGLRIAEPYDPRRMQYQPQPQPQQLGQLSRTRAGDGGGGCDGCGDCE